MKKLNLFLLMFLYGLSAFAGDKFVGSEECKSCHAAEFRQWQQSHHKKAMEKANASTVLGDFNDATFQYNGLTHRFYIKQGRYFVKTDNAQGKLQEFEISHVFGFKPLQQYLIPFPGGRHQVLSISWDSRPKKQGGQRWFHLYPDEKIDENNPLHWTGYFQNWNSRCASCHSTNLEKNYDPKSNSFETTYSEVNVACEACHGGAEKHLEWAVTGIGKNTEILSLKDSGLWQRKADEKIAHRSDKKHPQQQIETCAACHSLRAELSPRQSTGKPFHDNYQLRLLEAPHYFVDGQIREEVYVAGSFLQSKMYQSGVVCSDCHNPHSGKVKGEGNAVCLQCHSSESYQNERHHKHKKDSLGSQCVNCHMPETTYMGVDPRRDHSFSIPSVHNSEKHDVPNACSNCHHKDVGAAPSKKYKQLFGGAVVDSYVEIMHQSRRANPSIVEKLIGYVLNEKNAEIKRATALLELANFPSQKAFQTSMQMLQSDSALIRRAAIASLAYVPAEKRNGFVSLLNDADKSVRMELMPYLAPMPTERLPDVIYEIYGDVVQEYIGTQQANADMPTAQLNLANFYLSLGASKEAEAALRQALTIAPAFVPALLNIADIYRRFGQEQKAEKFIRQAIKVAPDSAVARHTLGLHQIRAGQVDAALKSFHKAVTLGPENGQQRYIYAVALNDQGQTAKAIAQLQKGLQVSPYNADMLHFLISLLEQQGRIMEAAGYRVRLTR